MTETAGAPAAAGRRRVCVMIAIERKTNDSTRAGITAISHLLISVFFGVLVFIVQCSNSAANPTVRTVPSEKYGISSQRTTSRETVAFHSCRVPSFRNVTNKGYSKGCKVSWRVFWWLRFVFFCSCSTNSDESTLQTRGLK